MSERVRKQRINPAQIIHVLETVTAAQLDKRNFRRLYAIPSGEGVDLQKEILVNVGTERVWRDTQNPGGHLGRLALPGEFAQYSPDYSEFMEI